MKKLITLLAAGILTGAMATGAFAQAAGPNGGGVQAGSTAAGGQKAKGAHSPVGAKLLKQLNLTPDQEKQVKELVKSFVQKRQQEQQTGVKPNRKQNVADRKQFMDDLSKILTPDQQAKLKQLIEDAHKKNKKNGVGTGTVGTGTTGTGTTGTGGGAKTGGGL